MSLLNHNIAKHVLQFMNFVDCVHCRIAYEDLIEIFELDIKNGFDWTDDKFIELINKRKCLCCCFCFDCNNVLYSWQNSCEYEPPCICKCKYKNCSLNHSDITYIKKFVKWYYSLKNPVIITTANSINGMTT